MIKLGKMKTGIANNKNIVGRAMLRWGMVLHHKWGQIEYWRPQMGSMMPFAISIQQETPPRWATTVMQLSATAIEIINRNAQ